MNSISGCFIKFYWISVVFFLSTACDSGTHISNTEPENKKENKVQIHFLQEMMDESNNVWIGKFPQFYDYYYDKPKLVIFDEPIDSVCGSSERIVSCFYCGSDQTIYIDLNFYNELKEDFPGNSEMAMAYAIAHLTGHHVQYISGLTEKIQGKETSVTPLEFQELLIRLELQTDYLAGVWAHHAQLDGRLFQEGNIDEALSAILTIEKKLLQKKGDGSNLNHTFNTLNLNKRLKWFKRGFSKGDLWGGDTFNIPFSAL